jgi:hypothetical protein
VWLWFLQRFSSRNGSNKKHLFLVCVSYSFAILGLTNAVSPRYYSQSSGYHEILETVLMGFYVVACGLVQVLIACYLPMDLLESILRLALGFLALLQNRASSSLSSQTGTSHLWPYVLVDGTVKGAPTWTFPLTCSIIMLVGKGIVCERIRLRRPCVVVEYKVSRLSKAQFDVLAAKPRQHAVEKGLGYEENQHAGHHA